MCCFTIHQLFPLRRHNVPGICILESFSDWRYNRQFVPLQQKLLCILILPQLIGNLSISSIAKKIALHFALASLNRQFASFFHPLVICEKIVRANIHLLWEYKLLRHPRLVDTKCELWITNTKIQVKTYKLQNKNYKQQKSIRKVTKIPRMPGRQPAQKSSFLLLFYRLQSSNKFSFTFENLSFCPAFPVSIYLNDSEGVG